MWQSLSVGQGVPDRTLPCLTSSVAFVSVKAMFNSGQPHACSPCLCEPLLRCQGYPSQLELSSPAGPAAERGRSQEPASRRAANLKGRDGE